MEIKINLFAIGVACIVYHILSAPPKTSIQTSL